MTAARSLLDLTHGEYCKLSPEDKKRSDKLYLRRCGLIDQAKLQAEHQKDFTEDQDDQYLGCARED